MADILDHLEKATLAGCDCSSCEQQRQWSAEIARLRAENKKMRGALVKIDHEYENKDLNHVDFRVLAKIMASEVLLTNGERGAP